MFLLLLIQWCYYYKRAWRLSFQFIQNPQRIGIVKKLAFECQAFIIAIVGRLGALPLAGLAIGGLITAYLVFARLFLGEGLPPLSADAAEVCCPVRTSRSALI